MKFATLILFFILVSLAVPAQNKSKPKPKKPPVKSAKAASAKSTGTASASSPALYQKWVHSYEDEKGDGIETYRPESYSFPPSRGRKAVKFQNGGLMVRFDIAPGDGQRLVMGKWERTKLGNTLKITVEGSENSVYFLEVISVGKDLLKVKRKLEI